MLTRLFHLLLCVLLIGPLSVPGSAAMHPENRVGGSPHFSSTFAPESPAQVTEPHRGYPPSDYDHALGLHKYLYAHADPVNRIDPSGHEGNFISTMIAVTRVAALAAVRTLGLHTVRGKVVATFGVAVVGGNEIYWRTRGTAPSPQEAEQIKAAIDLVASTGGYKDYADTAADLRIRMVETGETAEAGHVPVAWEVMLLWKEATNWELPILASVIVHEAGHSDQWVHVGTKWHEAEAYQAQSDFLRAVGVSGKTDELREKFPKADDYFLDLADAFRAYRVQNPAVY